MFLTTPLYAVALSGQKWHDMVMTWPGRKFPWVGVIEKGCVTDSHLNPTMKSWSLWISNVFVVTSFTGQYL